MRHIMKWCDSCNKTHGKTMFLPDLSSPDKKGNICKDCRRLQKEKVKKEKQIANKNRVKHYAKREFTSDDQILKIYNAQQGKCKICDQYYEYGKVGQMNGLHLDHSHITGKARGLLCGHCNRGIGFFNDNDEIILNAYNYLKDYK